MIPKGFKFAGCEAGIKKKGKDIGLIYSEKECAAAAVFTKNSVKAAPVVLDMQILRSPKKAILVNSGNANACTGIQGMKNAEEMQKITAEKLSIKPSEIFICSTGVIGQQLPMEKITIGISKVVSSLEANPDDFAKAIMTTDLAMKTTSAKIEIDGTEVTIYGAVKGSGMIAPNMATMLAFVVTDANIEKKILEEIWKISCDKTFNAITVDGDGSTNDTAIILANGAADNKKIDTIISKFSDKILELCLDLAKKIAADGEGANKLIIVEAHGAESETKARLIAMTIANSPLVKTAVYGNDANWGRIIAAAGRCGIEQEKTSILFGEILVFKNGEPISFNEDHAKKYLNSKEIKIVVNVGSGAGKFTAYTCDLTEGYIKINANYRS
ncbi:bifunctional glutamate N-acetyltransferase/amino-acid acetyltransferase ArgJ [Candidatus Woesearchaeota archaeon]|nr:bifunctional glutamate N-acetyltransferase/amino-acid acetyltransferase ArgJ [Candidatus Woesearchaeota archaeon]